MTTFNDINQLAHYHYSHDHSHSFTLPGEPLWGTLTQQKEPEMTILEQMRKERKEAIERQRIERVYAAYDEFNLDRLYDGTVLVFTWTPEGTDKTYTYAALRTGEKWYVTGRESPNGLDVEDFVAWLIGKDIEPDDLEVRAP